MKKIDTVFVGFGDLARRIAKQVTSPCLGVCRTEKPMPENVEHVHCDTLSADFARAMSRYHCANVVITLTPSQRSDEGYIQGYVKPVQRCIELWRDTPPDRIVFVSSTGVYGQNQGEWVSESSECAPHNYSGRRMLEAEAALRESGLAHNIVRLAGVYGPGRDFLQRQILAGNAGGGEYTNRIHVDDAARFITGLIQRAPTAVDASIVNVCDSTPAPAVEVRHWLAAKMNLPAEHFHQAESQPTVVLSARKRGGNKRCSNRLMLSRGFQLLYPSYKEGYSHLLGADDNNVAGS